MALPIKKTSVQYITMGGLFVAIGLVLHYGESLLPVFHIIPGSKLGLANIATMVAYSHFGMGFSLITGLLRAALSSLFAGNIASFLYSGLGTLFSIISMAVIGKIFPETVSPIGRSMVGAFFFNVGQLLVCALFVSSFYVFSYLPVLTLISAGAGLLTGFAAKQTGGFIKGKIHW